MKLTLGNPPGAPTCHTQHVRQEDICQLHLRKDSKGMNLRMVSPIHGQACATEEFELYSHRYNQFRNCEVLPRNPDPHEHSKARFCYNRLSIKQRPQQQLTTTSTTTPHSTLVTTRQQHITGPRHHGDCPPDNYSTQPRS